MIESFCDNCKKDCSGDYIYCSKCYDNACQELDELKETIAQLESEISELKDDIDKLENQ